MVSLTKDRILEALPSLTPAELQELAEQLDEMLWDIKYHRDSSVLEKHAVSVSAEHKEGKTEEIVCK